MLQVAIFVFERVAICVDVTREGGGGRVLLLGEEILDVNVIWN